MKTSLVLISRSTRSIQHQTEFHLSSDLFINHTYVHKAYIDIV